MSAPQSGVQPAALPISSVLIPSGAIASQIHGGPANKAHGLYEWDEIPMMPWQIVPGLDGSVATVQDSLIGQVPPNAPAGTDPQAYADPTSTYSHAAPWPRTHLPNAGAVNDAEATSIALQANSELHSIDSGDPAAFTHNPIPAVNSWERMGYVSAGEGGLDLPNVQMIGNSMTGFRRDSGWTEPGENLNRFGLDSAHVSRYRRTGDIPVPPNSTQGSQRPLRIQPASSRNYPVGEGSPFAGQTPGYYGVETATADYVGIASDYQASPDPVTGPALATQQNTPVWGYDLYG